MNKKFYTLVAGLLLASNVGTFAQAPTKPTPNAGVVSRLALYLDPATISSRQVQNVSANGTGYVEGIAYALVSNNKYLAVTGDNTLSFGEPLSIFPTRSFQGNTYLDIEASEQADRSLWILKKIVPGDQNNGNQPKYVFVNKYTQTPLAFNLSDVNKGVSTLGGSQTEWLSAPSYKEPASEAPIYAALGNDEYAVLATTTNDTKVSLLKVAGSATSSLPSGYELVEVQPHTIDSYTLSANELNTMLGKAGNWATSESYFRFNFSPEATMNGELNKLAGDLQAVCLMQAELQYGVSETTANSGKLYDQASNDKGFKKEAYSSLWPFSLKQDGTFQQLTDPKNEIGYCMSGASWVALRNPEGKYLVVDTAYVNGTGQDANKRITFAWDDLYNLKNDTRYRDPRSYLFKVNYNPSNESVEIFTQGYVLTANETPSEGTALTTLYQSNGSEQPVKAGQKWYATGTNGQVGNVVQHDDLTNHGTQVINAALVNLNEVTLGVPAKDNLFTIKLGNSAAYVPTTIAEGAYLIQVVDDDDPNNIGKYYVNNLVGGREIQEQAADRQNFQHMPAAQWIVKKVASGVQIINREFVTDIMFGGVPYLSAQGVFFASDPDQILKFIPVEDAADAYQGYKYVADDTIKVSRFTFNYLHELAMDKPINTVSAKDSVVWVDKNGEAMEFVLVPALSAIDEYGFNGGVSGVAQLKRMPYYLKVNDFSNVEDNERYLSYNTTLKKYVIGEDQTAFFLKENNEVDGGDCYYTFLESNPVQLNLLIVGKNADGTWKDQGTNVKGQILDPSILGAFYAEESNVKDPQTGLDSKKMVVRTWPSKALAESAYIYQPGITLRAVKFTSSPVVTWALQVDDVDPNSYASNKISVDNNTLNLTNGSLSDSYWSEVANSAFAAKKVDNPLYRRFNTALEGNEDGSDKPAVVNFYRVNATDKEYLYEDATSGYSKDLKFNFLGVEDKGVAGKNPAMYVDTAYVDRGDLNLKPQYMLVLNPEFVAGETNICDATNHAHATEEEAMACPHSSFTRDSLHGRFLINLKDSVDYHKNTALAAKYQWYQKYTRLGFVEATHVGDSLIIKNSVYTGNSKQINPKKETTWASKDTIDLNSADHKNVTFSFRLLNNNSNDFLIESEGASAIAPLTGGWVKIQNGVPVIANGNYDEAGKDAEIFNVEVATTAPTANEAVAAEVSVVAAQGAIIVKGAAGKVVTVANILGQTIANQVAASDNVTIAAPAGVAVVTVDGEATKVIVK